MMGQQDERIKELEELVQRQERMMRLYWHVMEAARARINDLSQQLNDLSQQLQEAKAALKKIEGHRDDRLAL